VVGRSTSLSRVSSTRIFSLTKLIQASAECIVAPLEPANLLLLIHGAETTCFTFQHALSKWWSASTSTVGGCIVEESMVFPHTQWLSSLFRLLLQFLAEVGGIRCAIILLTVTNSFAYPLTLLDWLPIRAFSLLLLHCRWLAHMPICLLCAFLFVHHCACLCDLLLPSYLIQFPYIMSRLSSLAAHFGSLTAAHVVFVSLEPCPPACTPSSVVM